MGFGALRVLNDDVIAPGGKFDTHAHNNFEIITIPLSGAVTHEDSLGNRGVVREGEVQVMSAGTGVAHSEENASADESLELFQIWIEPKARDVAPRYAQAAFPPEGRECRWQVVVSDGSVPGSLVIGQDARIVRVDLAAGASITYERRVERSGVYLVVIEGVVQAAGVPLARRDALGVRDTANIELVAEHPAQVLVIEVPMLEAAVL